MFSVKKNPLPYRTDGKVKLPRPKRVENGTSLPLPSAPGDSPRPFNDRLYKNTCFPKTIGWRLWIRLVARFIPQPWNDRATRARLVRFASRRRRRERSVTNRPTSPPRRYGWQVRVRSQTHTRHEHHQSSTSTRASAGLLTRTTTLADYMPRPTTTASDNVRGRNRPTPVRLSRRESEERARLARITALKGRRTGSLHARASSPRRFGISRLSQHVCAFALRRETAFC